MSEQSSSSVPVNQPAEDLMQVVIPQPIEGLRHSDAPVEHTYTRPYSPLPDRASTRRFTEYVNARFEGPELRPDDPTTKIVQEPYVASRQRTRITELGLSKLALGVGLGLFTVTNATNILQTLENAVSTHIVGQPFKDGKSSPQETPAPTQPDQPGPTDISIVKHYVQTHRSGEATTDQTTVQEVLDEVKSIVVGTEVTRISIKGGSSDDWGGRASLGRPDRGDQALAERRAQNFAAELQAKAVEQGVELPPVAISAEEHILSTQTIAELDQALRNSGYGSFERALRDYNADPNRLPTALRTFFDKNIGSQRADEIVLEKRVLGQPATPSVEPRAPEKNPDSPIDWALWPLLIAALPRLRTGRVTNSSIQYRPVAATEHGERPIVVRLYPEALDADGELVPDAWAYTRKYQLLLREQRIKSVLRLDYMDEGDPNNQDESLREPQPHTLRAMFIDHEPDAATVERTTAMLQHFSLMQKGKIGERLSVIAIYPEDNTGLEHGDPKRIGLGIDHQYDSATLGVTIPMLGLVEMATPIRPTEEQATAKLGPNWILAHEVAGHVTDAKDLSVRLYPLTAKNEYEAGRGEWNSAGFPLLPFSIRRDNLFFEVPDPDAGQRTLLVRGTDPRVQVNDPVIQNNPTLYSNASILETHAEVAAATMVTDRAIPSTEMWPTPKDTSKDFEPVNGQYLVHDDQVSAFQRYIGSNVGEANVAWPQQKWDEASANWKAHYGPATSDPLILKLTAAARRTRLPKNKRLITVMGKEAL